MTRERKLEDLRRRFVGKVAAGMGDISRLWTDFYRELARVEAEEVFGTLALSAAPQPELLAAAGESAIAVIIANIGTGLNEVDEAHHDTSWPPSLTDALPHVVRQAFDQRIAELQASFAGDGGRA